MASRDRFRLMGARQNLALYYNAYYFTVKSTTRRATPSQRSNAPRVRSPRHNFRKENTDKCRKFHFICKT